MFEYARTSNVSQVPGKGEISHALRATEIYKRYMSSSSKVTFNWKALPTSIW
jgi:hypothetical protein